MKAIWNNQTVAEAKKDELIRIEGNWYFPPASINKEYFSETDMHTTVFGKVRQVTTQSLLMEKKTQVLPGIIQSRWMVRLKKSAMILPITLHSGTGLK